MCLVGKRMKIKCHYASKCTTKQNNVTRLSVGLGVSKQRTKKVNPVVNVPEQRLISVSKTINT